MKKTFGITTIGLIALIGLCILLMLSGCSRPKEETEKVTLSISIDGDGTTTPAPGKHSIAKNTIVTLRANPSVGYGFSHWAGPDGGSVTDSNTLMMDKDRAITAVFTKLEYDLTIAVTPSNAGTVTQALVPDKGYNHGQIVHLTPVPAAGFIFDHWAGANAAEVTSENNILLDGDKALEAVFDNYLFEILIEPGDSTAGMSVYCPMVRITTPVGTPVAGITVTVAEKNGAPISGTLARTTGPDGMAGFHDLVFSEEGFYSLVFSSAGLANVESKLFRIGLAGAGSDTNPYQIHNIYGLELIRNNQSAVYRLKNDIDASDTGNPNSWYWNYGKGWAPLSNFKGTIDGNNHAVRNLYINRPDQEYVGLIGYTPNDVSTVIRNLHLADVNITGAGYTGALVGQSGRYTTIQNCSASGTVTGKGANVGGLLGMVLNANISHCSSRATVTGNSAVGGLIGYVSSSSNISRCYVSGNVLSESTNAGGLIGFASSYCTVADCYAWGDVSGLLFVGGFAGTAETFTTLSRCYSVGRVTGNSYKGGFVGEFAFSAFTDCFYDSTVCMLTVMAEGNVPKTTEELQDPDTFSGWDPAIWNIVDGQYPTLKPQS